MKFRRSFFVLALLLAALTAPMMVQAQGKSLTVAFPQEPDSLNPMYTTMTFADYTISLYLAGAWNFNNNLEANPVLVAEMPSIENGGVSEDLTTFTLKLKDGLVWSDGAPLTSSDFVFTWEMYNSESNSPLSRENYPLMESVVAVDPLTVEVKFAESFAPWRNIFKYVLPEHVLRPVFEAEGTIDVAEYNRAPSVGSGPYIFKNWNSGTAIEFEVNPNYANGVSSIETMIVRYIVDETAYVQSLIAGEIGFATFFPFSAVPQIESAGLEVQLIPAGYNEGWYMNTGENAHPAMQDVNVRKALALAFDRNAITDDLFFAATYPARSWWEGTPYANPESEAVPYDPDLAAQLLEEAGWVDSNGDGIREKDGVDLVIRFATNIRGIRLEIHPIVQQQLGEVGVGVELQSYPTDQFFNGYAEGGPIATGNYDIAQWSGAPSGFPDPDTTRFLCSEIPTPDSPSGANWSFYCDPELDALFAEQARTADFDARVAIFHQIDQRINEAYIWAGVWYDADAWSLGEQIISANINGVSPFWDVVNWEVK